MAKLLEIYNFVSVARHYREPAGRGQIKPNQ